MPELVILQNAINMITQKKTNELSYEEVYRTVYMMCQRKFHHLVIYMYLLGIRSFTVHSNDDFTEAVNNLNDSFAYLLRTISATSFAPCIHGFEGQSIEDLCGNLGSNKLLTTCSDLKLIPQG
jgi:hypothetical protein